MIRVKIFVVRTPSEAEYLIEQFDRVGIEAVVLDEALLHDDRGRPLFENRTAGVMCQVVRGEQGRRIDEVFRTLGVDAIGLERTLGGKLDQPGKRLAVAYQSPDAVQASLMRNLLEEQGVAAVVSGTWLTGEISAGAPVSVLVAKDDLEAAGEIISAAHSQAAQHEPAADEADEGGGTSELAGDETTIPAWPLCPGCQQRRTTMCPYCDTAGSEFPWADANFSAGLEEGQPRPLAVICTTCDEPWAAQFFRRCEWCGHDFGHGLKVDYEPKPTITELEPTNGRVLTVLLGLLALFALACIYFVLVIRS